MLLVTLFDSAFASAFASVATLDDGSERSETAAVFSPTIRDRLSNYAFKSAFLYLSSL
jgi:hypothetical protein